MNAQEAMAATEAAQDKATKNGIQLCELDVQAATQNGAVSCKTTMPLGCQCDEVCSHFRALGFEAEHTFTLDVGRRMVCINWHKAALVAGATKKLKGAAK